MLNYIHKITGGQIMVIKLQEYREKKGLSVDELAERTGVRADVISEIERGTAEVTTGRIMRRIAEALGVRVSDIFFN